MFDKPTEKLNMRLLDLTFTVVSIGGGYAFFKLDNARGGLKILSLLISVTAFLVSAEHFLREVHTFGEWIDSRPQRESPPSRPHAATQSCQQLWYERNKMYKDAGYCFKTKRAIDAFGNAGCIYQDEDRVPLGASERDRVESIRGNERALGCG